jgi:hypothetical protein
MFFLRTAGFLLPAVVFETEMFKKIITDLKAAVMLIATENLSALRAVFKNMVNWASRSARLGKKS